MIRFLICFLNFVHCKYLYYSFMWYEVMKIWRKLIYSIFCMTCINTLCSCVCVGVCMNLCAVNYVFYVFVYKVILFYWVFLWPCCHYCIRICWRFGSLPNKQSYIGKHLFLNINMILWVFEIYCKRHFCFFIIFYLFYQIP